MAPQKKRQTYMQLKDFVEKITPCPKGRNCTIPGCNFIHNLKLRMCKFENRCNRKGNCMFAHHPSELYVLPCKFGTKCNKEGCTFKHPTPSIFTDASLSPEVSTNTEFNIKSFDCFPKSSSPNKNLLKKDFDINHKKIKPVSYKDMKNIITFVDSITITGTKDEILSQYSDILNFNTMKLCLN
ncbi:hypothetical protein [Dasineura jujubifolia toursvirus 2a]|nr:hypothetical protein [Dasineura jujubifolia toursvirus 2a]